MSDISLEQTEAAPPAAGPTIEQGGMGMMEETESVNAVAPSIEPIAASSNVQRQPDRPGNVEHLATRRHLPPVNEEAPEVKQQIVKLRAELTALVTGFRWGGVSSRETAEHIIPLLNVGSLQRWIPVLVPNVLEIDRAGNLIPVWLKVIEQEEPSDLPPDANPAETMIGRARRFAVLMLGYYKSSNTSNQKTPVGFSKRTQMPLNAAQRKQMLASYKPSEICELLGLLSSDPNLSLYATQALVRQGTTAAMQALIGALKDAEGWAKVDVIEACVKLNQPLFNDILLASGLDRAFGLESYIAVPLFRSIALEAYLRGGNDVPPRLFQQAALLMGQVLRDSMSNTSASTLPIIFERDLPALALALFEGARSNPEWPNVIAIHRLALLLGRYWNDISRGVVQDPRIVQQVYACLPMMPDIERWINGPGRDVLLAALSSQEKEAFTPSLEVLSELHEPRVISILIARLDAIQRITDREQALLLAQMCDALAQLGDQRAVSSMLSLISRTLNTDARVARPKRRDNLTIGNVDLPASIVYAAVLRALGQLGNRSSLDFVERAGNDFDPYVRTQALEALKKLDPKGEEMRSRQLVRQALDDPRDSVVRIACQLATQYRDSESTPLLRRLAETRPELVSAANDALRQLSQ